MTLDLNSGMLIIGMAQGLFLACALLMHRKGPRVANRFLALLMLAFSLALLTHLLTVTGLWLPLAAGLPVRILPDGDAERAAIALDLGASDILYDPFDPEELAAALTGLDAA